MAPLYLQEEKLAEKVQGFPILYDKRVKGFKKRDTVQNIWEKIGENLLSYYCKITSFKPAALLEIGP